MFNITTLTSSFSSVNIKHLPSSIKNVRYLCNTSASFNYNKEISFSGPYKRHKLAPPIRETNVKFKSKEAVKQFRTERGLKVVKVELPDFHEKQSDFDAMTPGELRKRLKRMGIEPVRPWNERVTFITHSGQVFDGYIPPEADGKASILSTERAKQQMATLKMKGKSKFAMRKIRQYDEEFELPAFTESALKIYIDMHNALVKSDEDELHKLVTENCFLRVMQNTRLRTLRWAFHGSLEPARVVHVRESDAISKGNIFAQVTIRFHTQQSLAVYDRFGRLLHGSEHVLRDVLEYVIFEKQITNEYGLWRVHEKVIPGGIQARPTTRLTFRVAEEQDQDEEKVETHQTDIKKEEKEVATN